MAFSLDNFIGENQNIRTLESKGVFEVAEFIQDFSVDPVSAQGEYFMSKMNIRKKQLICILPTGKSVILQPGRMQFMVGPVEMTTGIKGAGDFLGKMVSSKVTGENAIKPEYVAKGNSCVVLEPTYKHLLLEDLSDWNGAMVIDDGLFEASEASVKQKVVARTNLSSALAGGEGIFNLCMTGEGIVCLESRVPRSELIEIKLKDDIIKIDGNMAIAWSNTLSFTVERSGKSLLGSATSGEGLVNVYRGTGKILLATN